MNIKSLSIRGWRSFAYDTPMELNKLRKINILIGANNCGKSNVFRYLYNIREMIKEKGDIQGVVSNYGKLSCVESSLDERDTWAWEKNDIIFDVELEDIQEHQFLDYNPTLHKLKEIKLRANHRVKDNISSYSLLFDTENLVLEEFQKHNPKIINLESMEYQNVVEGVPYVLDTIAYWSAFVDSLVFIDPVRHYSRNKSDFIESDFDGSDIVRDIIQLKNTEDRKWREYKALLEAWLSIILQEKIQLDPTDSTLRFYLFRGQKEIAATLENLGTGVSQLVMLLSFLYLNRDKHLNVFIEEPESNLHPEAVIQLVKIMEIHFPRHRFFITTHSSTLIDQVTENWSIHRVSRLLSGATKIESCNEFLTQYSLLDDLGIRPSQMLQSNLIIWVEGPSDRIYIKKWLKDKTGFLEGKHYSFLMYGGANLANYDLLDSDEYINILKTSRYSYIVCDSDKSNVGDSLKERVKRLQARIEQPTLGSEQKDMSEFVVLEVTNGREIENFVPTELFEQVLFDEIFLRKYIMENKVRKNLKVSDRSVTFDNFAAFDEAFSQKYIFEDDTVLSPEQYRKIANDLSNKKTNISKQIVEKWKETHYTAELNDMMGRLINHIMRANNIEVEQQVAIPL